MRKSTRILAMLAGLAQVLTACTVTYDEADVRREELRQAEEARVEEERNRKIGEAGGANQMAIDEENEEIIESDL